MAFIPCPELCGFVWAISEESGPKMRALAMIHADFAKRFLLIPVNDGLLNAGVLGIEPMPTWGGPGFVGLKAIRNPLPAPRNSSGPVEITSPNPVFAAVSKI